MTRIGIMQGRLLPPIENKIQCFPRDHWEKEFAYAAQANLNCIEWIYDLYSADLNPIATDAGIEKIKALSAQYNIQVLSLCADYFMDKPLVRMNTSELKDRFATLEWLMQRCKLLNMNRIVLPFVDASRINTKAEMDNVVEIIGRALQIADKTGIEIHLETSLRPGLFAELLSNLVHPKLKVNYDSGNSSSLGYNVYDEFAAYGPRVGSVHIKDRVFEGSTVPLGSGDADFSGLFNCLAKIKYSGDFILQAARGAPRKEIDLANHNRLFIENYLRQVS